MCPSPHSPYSHLLPFFVLEEACLSVGVALGAFAVFRQHTDKEKLSRRIPAFVGMTVNLLLFLAFMSIIHNSKPCPRNACTSNLKELSMALTTYCIDYDGKLPSGNWNKVLEPYHKLTTTIY